MIPQRELANLRAEWTLDQNVIEKDYVLGWLLAGIAHQEELASRRPPGALDAVSAADPLIGGSGEVDD